MNKTILILCGHTPAGTTKLNKTGVYDTYYASNRARPQIVGVRARLLVPTTPSMRETGQILGRCLCITTDLVEDFDDGLVPSRDPKGIESLTDYLDRNLKETAFVCVVHEQCLNDLVPAIGALYGVRARENPPVLRPGHVMVIDAEGPKIF